MSEFELHSLLIEYSSSLDAQFNFWMAITFAVVVASHTAGDQLNHWARSVLVFLYLLASAIFYVRYRAAVSEVLNIVSQLNELVEEIRFVKLAEFTGPGRRILMLSGTVFAVLAVVQPALLKHRKQSRD